MPRNVVKHNVETFFVGPAPATGYHFLVYHVNSGVALFDDNKQTGLGNINYNKILPLSRVQSYSYDFNFPRENVTYLGKRGLHNNPIINKPTINLNFDYLQNGLSNEKHLGFLVNYPTYLTNTPIYSYNPCPISGFFNKSTDFRNIFIGQSTDYSDINYTNDTNRANKVNTLSFGNCYIQGYKTQASIGNFPAASVSYICENMSFRTGSINIAIPAVLAKSGSLITNKGFDLPAPISTTGSNLSVLRPGDITTSILFSSDSQNQNTSIAILDAYLIPNGSDNSIPIQFSKRFATIPVVVGSLNNIGDGDPILGYHISNVTTIGFDLNFTDIIPSNNYQFNYLAAVGDGLLNVGITQTSGISGTYSIPSGVTNLSFVQFSQGFNNIPVVVGNIKNIGSEDPILNFHFSGVVNTGFNLNFTDTIPNNNYLFNYFATQNSGSGVGIYRIPSGVTNSNFIPFSGGFGDIPVVIGSIKNIGSGDPILGYHLSGVTTGGFYLNFTDTVTSSGYLFNYFVATAHNLFNLSVSPTMGLGYSLTDAKLQSYSIDLNMQREPLQSIGYVLPLDRRLNQPVFANLDFNYIVGDFETGNFKWQWFHDTEYDISIKLKNPNCPSFGTSAGKTAIEYSFLKAKINSKNENAGIGKNKVSSVSFITELDPDDLTKGMFISGLLNLNYEDTIIDPYAPEMTYSSPNFIWTWNLTNPIWWNRENSLNLSTWTLIGSGAGSTRSFFDGAGWYYRIRGVNALGVPTTSYSNVVLLSVL